MKKYLKKIAGWNLTVKVMLSVPIFMLFILISGLLLDNTPYIKWVSLTVMIGWCLYFYFIVKVLFRMIKGIFK